MTLERLLPVYYRQEVITAEEAREMLDGYRARKNLKNYIAIARIHMRRLIEIAEWDFSNGNSNLSDRNLYNINKDIGPIFMELPKADIDRLLYLTNYLLSRGKSDIAVQQLAQVLQQAVLSGANSVQFYIQENMVQDQLKQSIHEEINRLLSVPTGYFVPTVCSPELNEDLVQKYKAYCLNAKREVIAILRTQASSQDVRRKICIFWIGMHKIYAEFLVKAMLDNGLSCPIFETVSEDELKDWNRKMAIFAVKTAVTCSAIRNPNPEIFNRLMTISMNTFDKSVSVSKLPDVEELFAKGREDIIEAYISCY